MDSQWDPSAPSLLRVLRSTDSLVARFERLFQQLEFRDSDSAFDLAAIRLDLQRQIQLYHPPPSTSISDQFPTTQFTLPTTTDIQPFSQAPKDVFDESADVDASPSLKQLGIDPPPSPTIFNVHVPIVTSTFQTAPFTLPPATGKHSIFEEFDNVPIAPLSSLIDACKGIQSVEKDNEYAGVIGMMLEHVASSLPVAHTMDLPFPLPSVTEIIKLPRLTSAPANGLTMPAFYLFQTVEQFHAWVTVLQAHLGPIQSICPRDPFFNSILKTSINQFIGEYKVLVNGVVDVMEEALLEAFISWVPLADLPNGLVPPPFYLLFAKFQSPSPATSTGEPPPTWLLSFPVSHNSLVTCSLHVQQCNINGWTIILVFDPGIYMLALFLFLNCGTIELTFRIINCFIAFILYVRDGNLGFTFWASHYNRCFLFYSDLEIRSCGLFYCCLKNSDIYLPLRNLVSKAPLVGAYEAATRVWHLNSVFFIHQLSALVTRYYDYEFISSSNSLQVSISFGAISASIFLVLHLEVLDNWQQFTCSTYGIFPIGGCLILIIDGKQCFVWCISLLHGVSITPLEILVQTTTSMPLGYIAICLRFVLHSHVHLLEECYEDTIVDFCWLFFGNVLQFMTNTRQLRDEERPTHNKNNNNDLIPGKRAPTLLVHGNLSVGYYAFNLPWHEKATKMDFNTASYWQWLNQVATYYNARLQSALTHFEALQSHINIIYAAFYLVVLSLCPFSSNSCFVILQVCGKICGPFKYIASTNIWPI